MKKIGILGAGGFTGQELIKLLKHHPDVELTYITSDSYALKTVSEVLPHLASLSQNSLQFSKNPQKADEIPPLDLIFLAVPDEVSIEWVPKLLDKKIKVIDISGSFRIKDPELFTRYYKIPHNAPQLLEKAVYGLTEIRREQIKQGELIANPGCYATAIALPFLAVSRFIDQLPDMVITDAKSGTSGAGGRKEKDSMGYSSVYENFKPYKIDGHQHIPEIEQEISERGKVSVVMTPHLLPMFRGLQANTYLRLESKCDIENLKKQVSEFCSKEPFLRFYNDPNQLQLKNVQNTNFLDLSLSLNEQTNTLQIISQLDNLVKGAAGQAIQNMNLLFDFPENRALG